MSDPTRPMARELTLHDHCDRCLQAAVAVVAFEKGEVLLCGHHWRRFRTDLLANPAVLKITEPDDFDLFLPTLTQESPA